MPLFVVLPLLALFACPTEAAVSVSVNTVSTWSGGGQYQVAIKNNGPNDVCSVEYKLTLPSGSTVSSSWNMDPGSSSGQYKTPSWVKITNGATDTNGGFNVNGDGKPSVSVVSSTDCGGGSGTTTTTPASGTTTTTKASGTTTTTKSSGTTTTSASSGGTCGSATYGTDPSNAAINSCLKSSATGPILSQMNTPITGIFTFYGAGGTGACGQDSSKPVFSAAASGKLFSSTQTWVAPCTGSQYILKDAVCIGKCVKITYKCVGCSCAKTLIVPINNKCPECDVNHVDLSQSAFNYLEPQGGTVGIAQNAQITYIDC